MSQKYRTAVPILAIVLTLVADGSAWGDVGLVQIDKANQKQRSGSRFDISVTPIGDTPDISLVKILIRKESNETLLGATMTLHKSGNQVARIPMKTVQHGKGTSRSMHFWLSHELLQECEMDIGFDMIAPDSPPVGTCYRIQIESFIPGAPTPAARPR